MLDDRLECFSCLLCFLTFFSNVISVLFGQIDHFSQRVQISVFLIKGILCRFNSAFSGPEFTVFDLVYILKLFNRRNLAFCKYQSKMSLEVFRIIHDHRSVFVLGGIKSQSSHCGFGLSCQLLPVDLDKIELVTAERTAEQFLFFIKVQDTGAFCA